MGFKETYYTVDVIDAVHGHVVWSTTVNTRQLGSNDPQYAEQWAEYQFRTIRYQHPYAGTIRAIVRGEEADKWEANRAYGEALAEYGPERRINEVRILNAGIDLLNGKGFIEFEEI